MVFNDTSSIREPTCTLLGRHSAVVERREKVAEVNSTPLARFVAPEEPICPSWRTHLQRIIELNGRLAGLSQCSKYTLRPGKQEADPFGQAPEMGSNRGHGYLLLLRQ